jgi:hypothetical protein
MLTRNICIIIYNYLKASFDTLCDAPSDLGGDVTAKGTFLMRRLVSMAAFGYGFYYLWTNTDQTTELLGIGAMGFALLLEFMAPD